jgi:hypothetical protein
MKELSKKMAAVKISDYVAKYTPLLFSKKYPKNKLVSPNAIGSSVLIKIPGKHLLVTAAHVIIDDNNPPATYNQDKVEIGFMIENIFYGIGGNLRYFEPNIGEVAWANKNDIAFYDLCDETVDALKKTHDFLDFEKIEFEHYSEVNSIYGVYGYPTSDDSIKRKGSAINGTITFTPLPLLTCGAPRNCYDNNGIDICKKLILISGDQEVAGVTFELLGEPLPELCGISGCGVWLILSSSEGEPEFKLVGIITTDNEPDKDSIGTLLYATKIDALVDYIIAEKILSASNSK